MVIDALWAALIIIIFTIGVPFIAYASYMIGRVGKVLGVKSLLDEYDAGRKQ